MGTLTPQERDGLNELFLSMQKRDKYTKIKDLSVFIISKPVKKELIKLLKQAKYGLKETKKSYILLNFHKKKKNLSK